MEKHRLWAWLIVAAVLILGILIVRSLLREPRQFALSDEIHEAQGDPLRENLLRVIQARGGPSEASNLVGKSLAAALHFEGDVAGVAVGDAHCYADACYLDIDYPSKEAFNKVDDLVIQNPGSPFRRWPHGAGRTGLLRSGTRLFATWYFFREYQPVGAQPFEGARP